MGHRYTVYQNTFSGRLRDAKFFDDADAANDCADELRKDIDAKSVEVADEWASDAKVEISLVESDDELYCATESEHGHAPCFIEVDCPKQRMSAIYDEFTGGAVERGLYYGAKIRFGIPPLKRHQVNRLMAEIAPLVDLMIAGWIGDKTGGKLNEDGQTAQHDIEKAIWGEFFGEDDVYYPESDEE